MSALDTATSPYLLAHKDNPVAWRVWSNDVLAEAEAAGKPILLSIGYSACHWCHVMNRESFSDPETAKLINENFIPVIVDRVQRPDIDQIYQAAVQCSWVTTAAGRSTFSSTPRAIPISSPAICPRKSRRTSRPSAACSPTWPALYRDKPRRRGPERPNALSAAANSAGPRHARPAGSHPARHRRHAHRPALRHFPGRPDRDA